MPSLKQSNINASYFPNAGAEDERVETVNEKAVRTGKRDLGVDEPTSGPSTRRSSITAVGDDVSCLAL